MPLNHLNSSHPVFNPLFTAKSGIQSWRSAHCMTVPVYSPNYWQHKLWPSSWGDCSCCKSTRMILALPTRIKASSRKERAGQHFRTVASTRTLHGDASMNPPKEAAQPHTMPRHPSSLLSCSQLLTGWKERNLWASWALKEVRGLCLSIGKVEKGGMRGSSLGFPLEQSIRLQWNETGQRPRFAVFTLAKLLAANCGSLSWINEI